MKAHHDASPLYVAPGPYALGQQVTVRLRLSLGAEPGPPRAVYVRYLADGESQYRPARRDGWVTDVLHGAEAWYSTTVQVVNPSTGYRFLADFGDHYYWLNAAGLHDIDVRDSDDFRLAIYDAGPPWMTAAVGYQIFPDRFARRGEAPPPPSWAWPVDWDSEPAGSGPGRGRQLYGGNLGGITDRLDYLTALGVNLLYLTPFFPAPSNHRYNASSFDEVDPLLGGNAALAELTAAAHARGVRVMGDFTTNHCGVTHPWFTAARAGGPEADYFYWTDDELGYVGWFNQPSLPKFNFSNGELARRLWGEGPASVMGRWLGEPYNLDGWRIDVANMTGRHGADNFTLDLARSLRSALAPAPLVGEHFHDPVADLPGDGWHAVMNYTAFTKPLWYWLAAPGGGHSFVDTPPAVAPRFSGHQFAAATQSLSAGLTWPVLVRQWNMVDSHDTARIRTVTGSEELTQVALAALLTWRGTPVLFAGSELGLEGVNGENARRTIDWDRPHTWAHDLHAATTALIGLRHRQRALQEGSLRFVCTSDDEVVYEREVPGERLVVALARAGGGRFTAPAGACELYCWRGAGAAVRIWQVAASQVPAPDSPGGGGDR